MHRLQIPNQQHGCTGCNCGPPILFPYISSHAPTAPSSSKVAPYSFIHSLTQQTKLPILQDSLLTHHHHRPFLPCIVDDESSPMSAAAPPKTSSLCIIIITTIHHRGASALSSHHHLPFLTAAPPKTSFIGRLFGKKSTLLEPQVRAGATLLQRQISQNHTFGVLLAIVYNN